MFVYALIVGHAELDISVYPIWYRINDLAELESSPGRSRMSMPVPNVGPGRREFIQSVTAAAAGLLVGVTAVRSENPAKPESSGLTAWLMIAPDNTTILIIPSPEMGQGVTTSLAMLVAAARLADARLAPRDPSEPWQTLPVLDSSQRS